MEHIPAMPSTRASGKHYEEEAAAYLEAHGFRIIERNFRCRIGEIDLIARDMSGSEPVLVFAEVKFRTSPECAGGPLMAVGIRKQRTISRTAQYYLIKNRLSETGTPCRFDVIAITPGKLTHVRDAFPCRA